MAIKILDEKVINKIAAGEVIERPASAVKELVENSVDAGADKIGVHIAGAGIELVEIEDNGEGMTYDELLLAFQRHATSKISSEEDLFRISSMGFRGEALPSIAAVSKIDVYTQKGEGEGVYARIEGGQFLEIRPHPCPRGTKIIVRDLFYNTPVRKKFLKSPVTEARHVYDVMCRYSLARPDISFSFGNEKKNFFKTPGNGKLRDAVTVIYGKDFLTPLVDVCFQGENYSLNGLVSTPGISRINRKNQLFFINCRPVRSPLLYSAVDAAYKGLLLSREYPVVILALSVPCDRVDVNVHPQKNEVRFRDEKSVFKLVQQVIRDTLDRVDCSVNLPYLSEEQDTAADFRSPAEEKQTAVREPYLLDFDLKADLKQPNLERDFKKERDLFGSGSREYTIIGQCLNAYILLEMDNSLWLVDQHAAHERIMYNRLQKIYENSQNLAQMLAFPLVLEISAEQIDLLESNRGFFAELGFMLEPIGHNSILIRAVPALISGQEIDVLSELLDLIQENKFPDLKEKAITVMSCKKAVKAGMRLELREMQEIIEQLFAAENHKNCPHGRPTFIKLPHKDIDRMFKR